MLGVERHALWGRPANLTARALSLSRARALCRSPVSLSKPGNRSAPTGRKEAVPVSSPASPLGPARSLPSKIVALRKRGARALRGRERRGRGRPGARLEQKRGALSSILSVKRRARACAHLSPQRSRSLAALRQARPLSRARPPARSCRAATRLFPLPPTATTPFLVLGAVACSKSASSYYIYCIYNIIY